ncbi:MAG: glycosyltransferase family 4 protein [Geminicoccaceae bacterium]
MMPSRVLMTTDAVGGVWTYALELTRGLSELGVEVMLVVLGPPPSPAQRAEALEISGLVLVVSHLELEWHDRSGPLSPSACKRLKRLERVFAADLVHCNGFREAAAGFTAPVVLAAHSCVRTWWQACRGGALPADWDAYSLGVRQGIAAASRVVAPTAAFLADLEVAWGPLEQAVVIHNGVDLDATPRPRRRSAVLGAGRLWDEAKNVGALCRAAPGLPWPVLLAGEAPPNAPKGPASWLGKLARPALTELMAGTAIFAAPGRYEPFGLAILEAAGTGCALVLSNLPSLLELWAGAARFVAPGDEQGLRRELLDLIDDPESMQRLQLAPRKQAARYTRSHMLGGYSAVYRQLLDRADSRACAA